ncbi:L domain-like protein [Suillus decipiens]|nr:L domain-like protein [Suillus decipiens]
MTSKFQEDFDVEKSTPFTKLLFDLRIPQELNEWPPLRVHKRKSRNRTLSCLLIIILLFLIGNLIFLNVRVFTPTPGSSTSLAQQCLSQYTLNAPSNPNSYPCSTCLPILQTNYLSSNTENAQQILNAVQFCGLRAIFDTADSQGQASLSWMNDVKFCAWNGVTCDGSGRVANLQLTFPGVPATLPNELGALIGLESLQIIGGNNIPAGALPSSFTNLTNLSNLHIEATSITQLPDDIFSSLTAITTFTLIRNPTIGSSIPSSLLQLPLQNLVINSQPLANPLPTLSFSTALQASLKLLDLSSTSITGPIPNTISSFSSLTQLLLSNNNLQSPFPTTFPSSLQILNLQNNTELSGTLPNSLCNSTLLTSCELGSTGLSGGCGLCQFS